MNLSFGRFEKPWKICPGDFGILNELGYDARPAILGDINKETAYILKTAGVDVPPVLEDASGKNVVLVDHSEYSKSAEWLKDANVS